MDSHPKLVKFLLLCALVSCFPTTNGTRSPTQRNSHNNISELLDNLLRGYDNSVRPDFGGRATVIEVDLMIRSMDCGIDMTYSMDCYFRQSWVDLRLAFKTSDYDTLALSISMLAKIWKPDTYFYNGKQSYLHTITTPNKFVRLYQDGRVLYSSRLTIKAGCPMNLEDFPMDVQRCPLKFGSFGYTSSDVIYKWNSNRQAVAIADDMKLSQFDLVEFPAGNITDVIVHSVLDQFGNNYKSEYSMLLVSFHLSRHMGNFLIQVYGPCFLLVVLSWVSFWLNREATADRVSLGITTVLTMTFLGLEARTDLPKVPYPTALDYFVFLSFMFILASIIQFAIVHYFTKYGSGESYFNLKDLEDSDSEEDEEDGTALNGKPSFMEVIPLEVIPLTPTVHEAHSHIGWFPKFKATLRRQSSIVKSNILALNTIEIDNDPPVEEPTIESQNGTAQRKRKKRTPRFNSVSKIDRFSRAFFPLSFFVINIFYWYLYLYKTKK